MKTKNDYSQEKPLYKIHNEHKNSKRKILMLDIMFVIMLLAFCCLLMSCSI